MLPCLSRRSSVCHSRATVPVWLSLQILRNKGRLLCHLIPPTPHPCRRKGTAVPAPGRAVCCPWLEADPFPCPGRRESSADPDPRHRLCAGVGAAPAPARSQRLPWHQRRELLFKTVFSIRARCSDCAFIVGGLLLRPGD